MRTESVGGYTDVLMSDWKPEGRGRDPGMGISAVSHSTLRH